jgi:hypothetical protein
MDLNPIDPKVLVTLDRMEDPISGKEFFATLYRSLVLRWKLRKVEHPELSIKIIGEYECGGCNNKIDPDVHGYCPICKSEHIFYVGREAVLVSLERPKTNIWAKRHDRTSKTTTRY